MNLTAYNVEVSHSWDMDDEFEPHMKQQMMWLDECIVDGLDVMNTIQYNMDKHSQSYINYTESLNL